MADKHAVTMDKIVNLCKTRGIIFPGSEIYGGMGNTWDYGPVGVEVKNNIKRAWWRKFVQESENSFGVDAAILMNSRVWEASGHTASFTDPKMDCKECKARFRADNLIEAHSKGKVNPDTMTNEEMEAYIAEHKVACPNCGKHNWTPIRTFNLMFETSRGVTDESQNKIYLRPETAQGEFVNFLNVQRTTRAKIPFGIAQIGKSPSASPRSARHSATRSRPATSSSAPSSSNRWSTSGSARAAQTSNITKNTRAAP